MYAKIFKSLYQGTLRGDAHGILVFTNLLAHSDDRGYVDIHPKAIADEVGLSIDQVNAAIKRLQDVDEESRSPDMDGRRITLVDEHRSWGWHITNYCKYRAIRIEADRKEQNAQAQKKLRERKKVMMTVSNRQPPSSKSAQEEEEEEEEEKIKEKEKDQKKSPDGGTGCAVAVRQEASPLDVVIPKKTTMSLSDLSGYGLTAQEAADFLQHRKNKKAPLTRTAWKMILSESQKAGYTPAEAVKAMVNFGWTGFKSDWASKNKNSNQNMTFKERDESNDKAKYRERLGSMADFVLGPEGAENLNTIDENGNRVSTKMTRMPTFKEMFAADKAAKDKENEKLNGNQ